VTSQNEQGQQDEDALSGDAAPTMVDSSAGIPLWSSKQLARSGVLTSC
jgi:hypothetical protein